MAVFSPMNQAIAYLNTDLDLSSREDLAELAQALEQLGVFALHVTCAGKEGFWATFETNKDFEEPEPNIAAILDAVERLPKKLRAVWKRCTKRELNIGYDCGTKPWAFNQAISAAVLGRMAALGATLGITLYPPPEKDRNRGGARKGSRGS